MLNKKKKKNKFNLVLVSLLSLFALSFGLNNNSLKYNKVKADTLNFDNIVTNSSIIAENNFSWSINNNNQIIANSNRLSYYPQLRVRITDYLTSTTDILLLDYKFDSDYYLKVTDIYVTYGYPNYSDYYKLSLAYNNLSDEYYSPDKYGGVVAFNFPHSSAFDTPITYRYLTFVFDNEYASAHGLNFTNNIVGSINLRKYYTSNGLFSNETIDSARTDVINNDYRGKDYNTIYNEGFDNGKASGEFIGYQDGRDTTIQNDYHNMDYNTIYTIGRSDGYTEGINSNYSLVNEIKQLVNLPFTFANNALNFEILGLNMYDLFTSCITLLLLIWVIKRAVK